MTIYILLVNDKVVGIYNEHAKAYDAGCIEYGGFDTGNVRIKIEDSKDI